MCSACGRVAQRDARFCQDGHSLVQRCIKCGREFAVDHQRCDHCGWLQAVTPGTTEAAAVDFDRAVSDVTAMGRAEDAWQHIEFPLKRIEEQAHKVSPHARASAVRAILDIIPHLMRQNEDTVSLYLWQTLVALGSDALEPADRPIVLRVLNQSIERTIREFGLDSLGPHWTDLTYLSVFSPADALSYCSRALEHNTLRSIEGAVKVAFALGDVAIPTLERFCGLFAGDRGRMCKAAIVALRKGEKSLSLE